MAGELSSAFTGCSGLDQILNNLEGRGQPTIKPMAVKRRKVTSKAKGVAKAVAKPAAEAVAVAKAEAVAVAKAVDVADVPMAAAPVAEVVPVAGAVDVAAVPKPAAPVAPLAVAKAPLSDTRKCVHSRAYKFAAKTAKAAGLSPPQISAAACKAGKEATDKWDLEHPDP